MAQLAEQYGIATEFWDWKGRRTQVSAASVVAVLAAMGVDASTPQAIEQASRAKQEQAWRAMKEYLTQKGWKEAETASPRQTLKIASEAGLIRDEANWLKAMKDRSLELYVFRQEVADTLIADIRNIFLPLFRDLREELEKRYGN